MANRITVSIAKTTCIWLLVLFLVAGSSSLVLAGGSHSLDEIFDEWNGSIRSQEGPRIPVDLKVERKEAKLSYWGTRDCNAWAKYVESDESKHIYSLYVPKGKSLKRWCGDHLRSGDLELTLLEDGKLEMHLSAFKDGKMIIDETVNLTRN